MGGSFYIENMREVTHLDGFSGLTSVGGYLWISDNPALANLSGLSGLISVAADLPSEEANLFIYENPSLCQSLVDAFVDALGAGLTGIAESFDKDDR